MNKMYECLFVQASIANLSRPYAVSKSTEALLVQKYEVEWRKKITHSVIDRWLKMELMWKRSKKKANTNDLKTKK